MADSPADVVQVLVGPTASCSESQPSNTLYRLDIGGCRIGGMARHIILQPHLSSTELEQRYRAAKEPNERSWWQILWLLSQGRTGREVATVTGYSPYWIGQIAKRYNAEGPDGMQNRRHTTSHRAPPALSRGAARGAARRRWRRPSARRSAGRARMWRRGSASASVARSPTRWGTPTCSGSSTASNCRGRSMSRPTLPHRKPSKKDRTAAARGRDRISPRHGRTVGDGRASHRPQAAPAPHLGARSGSAPSPCPAPLRLALSGRLRPSRLWAHPLPSGDQRQHPAL